MDTFSDDRELWIAFKHIRRHMTANTPSERLLLPSTFFVIVTRKQNQINQCSQKIIFFKDMYLKKNNGGNLYNVT